MVIELTIPFFWIFKVNLMSWLCLDTATTTPMASLVQPTWRLRIRSLQDWQGRWRGGGYNLGKTRWARQPRGENPSSSCLADDGCFVPHSNVDNPRQCYIQCTVWTIKNYSSVLWSHLFLLLPIDRYSHDPEAKLPKSSYEHDNASIQFLLLSSAYTIRYHSTFQWPIFNKAIHLNKSSTITMI